MSAARVGASIGFGLIVGCLPIFGLHLPIVFFGSLRMRLDGALAYLAANISNPFFAPILFTGEVQVGALVVDGRWLGLGQRLGLWDALAAFPKYLLIGSPIVAVGAGLVIGSISFALVGLKRKLIGPASPRPPYSLPESAPEWIQAVERVASRYASPNDPSPRAKTQFNYVRIKLVMDPIAKLIAGIAGDGRNVLGEVTDVGTGRGQLPILLVELGRSAAAHGFDWDEKKIEDASRAAKVSDPPLPVSFERGDAREAEIPPSDTVLLIDILHYFKEEEQDRMLRRAAKSVRSGGRILVREADTERGWRSTVTRLEEAFFTTIRFNRGERVVFRKATDLAKVLEEEGMTTRIEPAWGRTPFSNVLIVGERPLS